MIKIWVGKGQDSLFKYRSRKRASQ